MNLPTIIDADCYSTTGTPPDKRCDDPAFALANPQICRSVPTIVVKPGFVVSCSLGSIQFKAFLVQGGTETELTSGVTWSTSKPSVALVGAISGNATGIGAGIAVITASYQGSTGKANMSVLGGTNCCESNTVDTVIVYDVSKSMGLAFEGSYDTKQDFASAAAQAFIAGLNTAKGDKIGITLFDESPVTAIPLSNDKSTLTDAIQTAATSTKKTGIGLALQKAYSILTSSTANIRVVLLISDGEDKDTLAADSAFDAAKTIKEAGIIVICLGVRAHDAGFNLLEAISTGGFFLNAYDGIDQQAIELLKGLKGYLCAGNCVPEGDVYENLPALDFSTFQHWMVTGHVDLFGPGLFDLLPGNGLYVNLANNLSPYSGALTSLNAFDFYAGKTYRITVRLAGNQRKSLAGYRVNVKLGDGSQFTQDITITDYTQDFQDYAFSFVPAVDFTADISITQITNGATSNVYGNLLSSVKIEDVTDVTTMFFDDFEEDNLTYIPPKCGDSVLVPGFTGEYCDGDGCLSSPPPSQAQDPSPLSDVEGDFVPPTTYTSTKSFTATCPTGSDQVNSTTSIPVMTSPTAPSGEVISSGLVADGTSWKAFGQGSGAAVVNWLGYIFDTPKKIVAYAVTLAEDASGKATTIMLQGSDDGVEWIDVAIPQSINCPVSGTLRFTFMCAYPQSFRYYRIQFYDLEYLFIVKLLEMFEISTSPGITKSATATSTVSQADADNKATAQAQADAEAALAVVGCIHAYVSTQTFKATCPVGTFGPGSTKTATSTSYLSQADADSQALADATAQANASLVCDKSNNTSPITITDNTSATPYPSVQFISGMTGAISQLFLTFPKFAHQRPRDVQMMLMGPDGTKVMLMQQCGATSNTNISNFRINSSGTPMPSGAALLGGVSYTATQYTVNGPASNFPAPAPAGPYGISLADFIGKDPNGPWSLWIMDTQAVDSGSCANGWYLTITTE